MAVAAPDTAKHGGGEGFHARHKAVGKRDHAVVHQVHGAGDRGQGRGDDKSRGNCAVDIDPDQSRHFLVLLAGPLRAPEPGARHQIPKRQQQDGGNAPNDELLVR